MADVRIETPHNDDEYHQWVILDGAFLQRHRGLSLFQLRDKIGRPHRHAWRDWLTLICNNPSCPGVALVRCEAIGDMAARALGEAVDGGESDG